MPEPPVPRFSAGGGVWADFGSGAGAFTLALAELLGPGGTIYAIDRNAGALRELARAIQARFVGITLHQMRADFTRPLDPPLPPLDGVVMANSLHFVPPGQQLPTVQRLRELLRPGGRLLLVEYNLDRGNPWVPHPLSYPAWVRLAAEAGFQGTRQLAVRPSRFMREIYSAESLAG